MKAVISNNSLPYRIYNLFRQRASGHGFSVQEIATPTITSNEILVKVQSVALNPIDFKNLDALAVPGRIVGCDFAGIVDKVGDNAASTWSIGDRVAGLVHGGMYTDRRIRPISENRC